MTDNEPTTMREPVPAEASRTRRRLSRPLALGLAAAVLAGGTMVVAGGAWALDTANSSSPSASSGSGDGSDVDDPFAERSGKRFGWRGGGHHGRAGMHGIAGLGPMGGIRSEIVVPDGDDGYRTLLSQTGEVTTVDNDSLTVRSKDGYTHDYAVTKDTVVNGGRDGIGDIETGDTVHVLGQADGGTDTALRIGDLSTLRDQADRFGMMGRSL